jgi:hypothetical protein
MFKYSDKLHLGIERAIKTRHKTLIHEMIDNYKADGYTFGVERRKSKTGKIYSYLYRQKRNVNGKTKEHISLKAKDLDDYRDNVLLKQAKIEVLGDKLGGWAEERLTPSEMQTFHAISNECLKYRKLDDRNPVIERYIKQLGLRVINRRHGSIAIAGNITVPKEKNILKAAKKALTKQIKSRKKLIKIIDRVLNGDHSDAAINGFIKNVVKESKCRNRVKDLQNYIKWCIERDGDNPYSILEPSEAKSIAEEILWINKKSKKLSF